jgi:hypothetical protein
MQAHQAITFFSNARSQPENFPADASEFLCICMTMLD